MIGEGTDGATDGATGAVIGGATDGATGAVIGVVTGVATGVVTGVATGVATEEELLFGAVGEGELFEFLPILNCLQFLGGVRILRSLVPLCDEDVELDEPLMTE